MPIIGPAGVSALGGSGLSRRAGTRIDKILHRVFGKLSPVLQKQLQATSGILGPALPSAPGALGTLPSSFDLQLARIRAELSKLQTSTTSGGGSDLSDAQRQAENLQMQADLLIRMMEAQHSSVASVIGNMQR